MNIFFDTEFIEDGQTIDLISIGMVREDGAELYLCNREAQLHRASEWVRENVLPHLPPPNDSAWRSRHDIAELVQVFALAKGKPQFWAYYADYDWVALCQLFGRMIDLPKGFPMYCMDLKQWSVMLGNPQHPEQTSAEHHALADARWNRDLYAFLATKGAQPDASPRPLTQQEEHAMAAFWSQLKKQATADAKVGSVQSDVQVAIKAFDKILANPEATVQEIIGRAEASSWKTQFVQGLRELGKSAARVLGTRIPR